MAVSMQLTKSEAMMFERTPTVERWLQDILDDVDRNATARDVHQIKLTGGPVYVGVYVNDTDTTIALKLWGTNVVATFAYRDLEYMLAYDHDTGYMIEAELG